jgi:hypothetical protein
LELEIQMEVNCWIDHARVEGIRKKLDFTWAQIGYAHELAEDVRYLLSLLPQLSSSELARRIRERAVEIRKAGNDSSNERDQQCIEGGISALEVLADDIEDRTFPVSSSERGNEETLDSLPEYLTEEEAESYLQACGTSGKEVVNQFIERLLKERLEFKEEVERLRVLLSSSEPCICGHAKSEHESFSDHDECLRCRGLDEPCSEFRAVIVPVEPAPAGVEEAAKEIADWITQTTPLAVGSALRSSIQRIIFKHCAAPVAAESEEAEPVNGSEDSWMTL